jgi:hypothetical protein
MSDCSKKLHFFIQKQWTDALFVSILTVLFTAGFCTTGAEKNAKGDKAPTATMSVRVKFRDANKLNQTNRLKTELNSVQRSLTQFERLSRSLKGENELLKKELIEIIKKFKKQNESYRRLQLSVAATLASEQIKQGASREDQLVKAMSDISDNGRKLALKTIEFCDRVEQLLQRMPVGKLQKAQITLSLEDLKSEARRFNTMTDLGADAKPANRCRILAINRDLQIVVLPVGSIHGAFNGLRYYTGKGRILLKIISTRPFISAAVIVQGNIDDMAPGMEAVTDVKMLNK